MQEGGGFPTNQYDGENSMHSQIPALSEFHRALLRAFLPVLGLISFSGGIGLAFLSGMVVYKQVTYYGRLPSEPFIFVIVSSIIAVFCSVAGFRLIFYRNDRSASS